MSGSGMRATSGAGGGGVAHPASHAAQIAPAIEDNGRTRVFIEERVLGWVFLEILAALAIAVAIVWWTIPKAKKPEEGDRERGEDR
jgi:hypothetical protein